MLKANDFDRDGCRTFIVLFPCRKMKTFLFTRIIFVYYNLSYWLQSLRRQSVFLTYFNPWINNLCSATFIFLLSHSSLQIQHKLSFLLVLIPTQTMFPTCLDPKINLRYLCNFSSFSFYSSED